MEAPLLSRRGVQQRAQKMFRLAGLTLTSAAMGPILETLADKHTAREVEDVLAHIAEAPEINKGSALVSGSAVSAVLERLTRDADSGPGGLTVIDAFDTPRYTYNPSRRTFHPASAPSEGGARGRGSAKSSLGKRPAGRTSSLHGSAADRVALFRERFGLAQQRVLRTDIFSAPGAAATAAAAAAQGRAGGDGAAAGRGGSLSPLRLSTIDALLGMPGQTVYVLGMLKVCERNGGTLMLEDLTKEIELDMRDARVHEGLITEGCFVLVEGEFVDDTLRVSRLGFPPTEPKSVSRQYLGKLDLFGARREDVSEEELLELEEAATDAMFVFLSDVHLDSPRVMRALRTLFEGYAGIETVPALFVLMGNFTAAPVGLREDPVAKMRGVFDALADLICEFPSLVEGSHFLFLPGPRDLTAGSALPRPRVPAVFTRGIESRIPCTFASSVARLRYFTQEIVLSRHDLLSEMRRNCVIPPPLAEDGTESDVSELLVRTICDQAHLAPLPLYTAPIHWAYDHALRLFPLPDVCVLADRHDQYEWDYEQCLAVNPGPFHADLAFVVYHPAIRRTQYSRIPPEELEDAAYLGDTTVRSPARPASQRSSPARTPRRSPAAKAAAHGSPGWADDGTENSPARRPLDRDRDRDRGKGKGKGKGKGRGRGRGQDTDAVDERAPKQTTLSGMFTAKTDGVVWSDDEIEAMEFEGSSSDENVAPARSRATKRAAKRATKRAAGGDAAAAAAGGIGVVIDDNAGEADGEGDMFGGDMPEGEFPVLEDDPASQAAPAAMEEDEAVRVRGRRLLISSDDGGSGNLDGMRVDQASSQGHHGQQVMEDVNDLDMTLVGDDAEAEAKAAGLSQIMGSLEKESPGGGSDADL